MGFVDKLEKDFVEMGANQVHRDTLMVNGRYVTLMDMKKFILEDMTYHFIDQDVKALLTHEQPTRDLVTLTIKRWEEFCDKYSDYLDKQQIKDYIVGQLMGAE